MRDKKGNNYSYSVNWLETYIASIFKYLQSSKSDQTLKYNVSSLSKTYFQSTPRISLKLNNQSTSNFYPFLNNQTEMCTYTHVHQYPLMTNSEEKHSEIENP